MKRLVIEVSNDVARELERAARDSSETVEAVAARALEHGLPKCADAQPEEATPGPLPTFTPPEDAQGLVEGRSWDDLRGSGRHPWMRWKALPAVFDVNVLVYAFRDDSPCHEQSRSCIEIRNTDSFILPDIIALGFVRVVTNRRIFASVAPPSVALSFINDLRQHGSRTSEVEVAGVWEAFERIATRDERGGDSIPDAYLAAVALAHDAPLYTFDRDFARYDGLRVQEPE